jgi:hypothetical protein
MCTQTVVELEGEDWVIPERKIIDGIIFVVQ